MNIQIRSIARALMLASVALSLFSLGALAQELPKSTLKLLAQAKVDPIWLKGIDEELKVPADWIEKAKKEGQFRIAASDQEQLFRAYIAPFVERYPFITAEYEQGSYNNRVIKPLLALKQGRLITDMTTSLSGSIDLFNEANALVSLKDIPNYDKVRPELRPDSGLYVSKDFRFWCMAYNTQKVKKEALPKTWDDMIKMKEFHNNVIGVNDRSMTWLVPLRAEWSQNRTATFIEEFMGIVKPQLRGEGINALSGLTAAGEVLISIPAGDTQVKELADKGGNIGWHCPDPVPATAADIALFRGSPHTYASKLFINWLLSREGQLAQYAVIFTPPVHKDLPLEQFTVYPDEIKGKKLLVNDANSADENVAEVQKIWGPLWEKRMQTK